MSFNTIGYQVVNNHLQSSFALDIDGFRQLLARNVELHYKRKGYKERLVGIDEVMAKYKTQFFDVTSNFDIQKVKIYSNGLKPEFICKVSENKKENDKEYRARFRDHTILHLTQEDEEWKIEKIIKKVKKKVL